MSGEQRLQRFSEALEDSERIEAEEVELGEEPAAGELEPLRPEQEEALVAVGLRALREGPRNELDERRRASRPTSRVPAWAWAVLAAAAVVAVVLLVGRNGPRPGNPPPAFVATRMTPGTPPHTLGGPQAPPNPVSRLALRPGEQIRLAFRPVARVAKRVEAAAYIERQGVLHPWPDALVIDLSGVILLDAAVSAAPVVAGEQKLVVVIADAGSLPDLPTLERARAGSTAIAPRWRESTVTLDIATN